jgi:diacylglycerol kinase (ATP)
VIKSVLLVVNPGSRRGRRRRPAAEAALRAAGLHCEVAETERGRHASDIVRHRASSFDAVFVLGGDGTVMQCVGALAGTERPVGVLPGGTGNLIAGALGIPANVTRAVRALMSGQSRRLDLARLGSGAYFAFAAGLGIDASMVAAAGRASKRRWGMLAYVLTAANAAFRREDFDLVATVDGRELRTRASLAMVANAGALFRGLFVVGPDVSADDGTLDLCVFSPTSATDVVGIAWRILRKDFRPHPRMRFLKGKRICLASDPPRSFQADGDIIGMTPVEIDVAPLAATFLVPRR